MVRGRERQHPKRPAVTHRRVACATHRTDLMVACYPGGGAAYGPHVDNADGDGREELDYGRCFTAVFYLNSRWDEADGGALRVHLPQEGKGETRPVVDIYPHGDTLVLFRADRVLHEVRPSQAARLAMTVWLYAGTKEQQERERRGGNG